MEIWIKVLEICIFAMGGAVMVICAFALLSIAATVIRIIWNLKGK